jgi:hypothetical protein
MGMLLEQKSMERLLQTDDELQYSGIVIHCGDGSSI